MTDAAFLQAIAESPDDDTHRLVYADWLDDHADEAGRDRASLIRAQCEAERLPANDRRRKALEKQGGALLKAHPEWAAPLRRSRLGARLVFRRGFPHGLTMSPTRFVLNAEKLFRLAPTLRAVRFPNAANELSALAGCPGLGRLAEVDLSAMCSCGTCRIAAELRDLFASPHVSNLTWLRLSGDRIDPAGMRALAESPLFYRLRTLDLSDNRLGNGGARSILRSGWMGNLTRLDVSHNDIGEGAKQDLVGRFGDRVVV